MTTILYQHPDGGKVTYCPKSAILEVHCGETGDIAGVHIGQQGLIELAAATARLAASLLEGQP